MLHCFIHTKNGCGILIKTGKLSPLYLLETFAEKKKRPVLGSRRAGHHSLKLRCDCVPRLAGVSALRWVVVVTEEDFNISLHQQFSFLLQGAFALPALASQRGSRNFHSRGFLNMSLGFRLPECGTAVGAAHVSDWHTGATFLGRRSLGNSPVQN